MLTVQVLAGLLIFTHCLGAIVVFFVLYVLAREQIAELGMKPIKHFKFAVGVTAIFWEILVLILLLASLWDCIAARFARNKYDRIILQRWESCPGHFQKDDESSKIFCQDCGIEIDSGDDDMQRDQEDLDRAYRHRRESEQWKKFKRSIWYKHLR